MKKISIWLLCIAMLLSVINLIAAPSYNCEGCMAHVDCIEPASCHAGLVCQKQPCYESESDCWTSRYCMVFCVPYWKQIPTNKCEFCDPTDNAWGCDS